MQTHMFCWSFVSTCADDLCHTLTNHRECNNGLSIASAACSTELGRPSASNNETTHSNKHTEDDAGNCFMLPTALRERIKQQPTSLLKFLTHCESMLIAPRTQAFRRSFVSSCAVEQDTIEACNVRKNWQSTFASYPLERDASRATDAKNKHPQRHQVNDDYNDGMSTRSALLYAIAAAVRTHAQAKPNTLLIAMVANATSQHTRLEVHTQQDEH